MAFRLHDREMNFTFESHEEMCSAAFGFRRDTKFLVILSLESTMSLTTLCLMGIIFWSKEFKRIWSLIGRDLKIVLFVGFSMYLISTANAFLTSTYKLFILILKFEPCFYVWNGFHCFWANNIYIIICMVGFAWFHISLFLERLLTTFFDATEKFNGVLGVLLGILILAMAPLPQIIMYNPQAINYDRIYCASTISTTTSNATFVNWFLLFGDYLICGCDFLLYRYNKTQIEKYKKRAHSFSLQRSFKLRELDLSISWIYPFSVCHTLTFGIQIWTSYNYARNVGHLSMDWTMFYSEIINFSRILINFILVAFVCIFELWKRRRRSKQCKIQPKRNEIDVYFAEFERIIA